LIASIDEPGLLDAKVYTLSYVLFGDLNTLIFVGFPGNVVAIQMCAATVSV